MSADYHDRAPRANGNGERRPDHELEFANIGHARWRCVGGTMEYVIYRDGDTLVCSCPGFSFRRRCRHGEELQRRRDARRARGAT